MSCPMQCIFFAVDLWKASRSESGEVENPRPHLEKGVPSPGGFPRCAPRRLGQRPDFFLELCMYLCLFAFSPCILEVSIIHDPSLVRHVLVLGVMSGHFLVKFDIMPKAMMRSKPFKTYHMQHGHWTIQIVYPSHLFFQNWAPLPNLWIRYRYFRCIGYLPEGPLLSREGPQLVPWWTIPVRKGISNVKIVM